MSTSIDLKSLELQAVAAIESGDPADAQRFAQAYGMAPSNFQAQMQEQGAEQLVQTVQEHLDYLAGEAEMLKQQREHEEEMASEPQVAWEERGWNTSDDGLSESKKCVVRYPDGTFVSSLMTSWRGGEPAFESIGVERSSLAEAKADAEGKGKVQNPTLSVSELTRAYNERLHKALSQAEPIITKTWTAQWKKEAVVAAVAAPVTDSREQALKNTFLIQDCWANVYEPHGNYKSPELKALAEEFSVLLRGEFFEQVPKQAQPVVAKDDSPSPGM